MAMVDTLILEVTDFKDPQHWRWVLKDSSDKSLIDQKVGLDPTDPNYLAFLDLPRYLHLHSSPDNRTNDQERLLDEMRIWIGSNVLGEVANHLAECRKPTGVLVQVPPEASGLNYLPLELARVGDRPLALQDLSLVFEAMGSKPSSTLR